MTEVNDDARRVRRALQIGNGVAAAGGVRRPARGAGRGCWQCARARPHARARPRRVGGASRQPACQPASSVHRAGGRESFGSRHRLARTVRGWSAVTAEFKRLGKRGSYRLGQLRAQGIARGSAAGSVPAAVRPRRTTAGPRPVWLLGLLAGSLIIAAGARAGWWFAPFVVGVVAGLANWIGAWRLRVALPRSPSWRRSAGERRSGGRCSAAIHMRGGAADRRRPSGCRGTRPPGSP